MAADSNRLARIAVIGALAAALGLAACGRKGPLDPPPSANAAERTAAGDPQAGGQPPVMDAEGRPVAPDSTEKRRIVIDWLLD